MATGIAVVGVGRWGLNHVRTLAKLERANLIAICDDNKQNLANAQSVAPEAQALSSLEQLLSNEAIEAVVLATPPSTHAELATACLNARRHVLVEKPLTCNPQDAAQLVELAHQQSRVLQVGHLCVHQMGVEFFRDQLARGQCGKVQSMDAVRTSMPSPSCDVDVIWDLAVHDIAVFDYLVGTAPIAVCASGITRDEDGRVAEAHVVLQYAGQILGHVFVSWRSPLKVRRTTINCSNAVIGFDDLNSAAPISIETAGGMTTPALQLGPLALNRELNGFIDAINGAPRASNDGDAGLRVVNTLASIDAAIAALCKSSP